MAEMLIKSEVYNRVQRFQKRLSAKGLDGALIVEKTDLYYFSGTKQDGHLFIPAEDEPVLMVRKDFERAVSESPLEEILPLPGYSVLPHLISKGGGLYPRRMGLEMDVLPASRYFLYQKLFPKAELVDVSRLIRETRMVKSDYEIARIRAAAEMADGMYEKIPEFLTTPRTELELSIWVEAYYRKRGHPGIVSTRGFNLDAIYGHIMAGRNAAMPSASPGPTGGKGLGPFYSQGAGWEEILPHTPILIDYCASLDGYVADSTRIFSIGELKPHLVDAHEVMLEIQATLMRLGVPGAKAEDLYRAALAIVEKNGLMEGFMGIPKGVPFVAHGIGLELDEWPVIGKGSKTVLEAGMVIAMEPKAVFPGEGVVGIENTLLVTEKGLERVTRFPDGIMVC
ncbi:MAG: Xaa-Pro peptidase family protein [Deltaproteobacteria bacterium]|nr:Xaa-Pro peptidase family protein [Deltaproteobacteria bacterium]